MNYNGQSLSDRLQAARYTLLGSALSRGVFKATTEELGAPKKKHLDYLKQCTYGAHISIPQLVELLIDRTRTNNWIVTFKALITIHHLLNNGNERFGSCFASCGHKLNLGKFFDRSNLIGFEMSSCIRKYAAYIDSKREVHRIVGYDLCRAKRGDDGFLRKLSTDKLFRTLVVLTGPIDNLTQFKLNKTEMVNSIVGTTFRMLCKDASRLYACYNDGIISLLEKFFDLSKKECAEALELYRGFISRSEQLTLFLKSAEGCGVDRGGIPDLIKAPSSLLETLESHFAGLNNDVHQSSLQAGQRQVKLDSELSALSNAYASNYQKLRDFNNEEKLMALDDEAKAMQEFNKRRVSGDVISLESKSEWSNSSRQPGDSKKSLILNASTAEDLLDLNFGWDTPFNDSSRANAEGSRKESLGLSGLLETINQLNIAQQDEQIRTTVNKVPTNPFYSSSGTHGEAQSLSEYSIPLSAGISNKLDHTHAFNTNLPNIENASNNPFASGADAYEELQSNTSQRNIVASVPISDHTLPHFGHKQMSKSNLFTNNPFLDDDTSEISAFNFNLLTPHADSLSSSGNVAPIDSRDTRPHKMEASNINNNTTTFLFDWPK